MTTAGGTTGGVDAYSAFLGNATKHANTPLTNNIGLKTLFSFTRASVSEAIVQNKADDPYAAWKALRTKTFAQRKIWYGLSVAALMALTVLACARV